MAGIRDQLPWQTNDRQPAPRRPTQFLPVVPELAPGSRNCGRGPCLCSAPARSAPALPDRFSSSPCEHLEQAPNGVGDALVGPNQREEVGKSGWGLADL